MAKMQYAIIAVTKDKAVVFGGFLISTTIKPEYEVPGPN